MHLNDLLIIAAGFVAGLINGVAGGGSMVSFPALVVIGLPALQANVTSTVGIWSGYLGGAAGFRSELAAQPARIRSLAPVALAGAGVGAVLLLATPEDLFEDLAPILVLGACALFAAQPLVARRVRDGAAGSALRIARWGTFGAAIYGAYFGAGLGVILLAVLGLCIEDTLVRINGLRGLLALLINSLAVVVFVVAADVAWRYAALLAVSSLVGGYTGARVSRRLPTPVLRGVVLGFGVSAGVIMLVGT